MICKKKIKNWQETGKDMVCNWWDIYTNFIFEISFLEPELKSKTYQVNNLAKYLSKRFLLIPFLESPRVESTIVWKKKKETE